VWLGIEQDGFHLSVGDLTVDVGLFALILKILDGTHTFNDEMGVFGAGEVYGQSVIRLHLHPWFVGIEPLNVLHALGGGGDAGLAHMVADYTDDEPVEELPRPPRNTHLAAGGTLRPAVRLADPQEPLKDGTRDNYG